MRVMGADPSVMRGTHRTHRLRPDLSVEDIQSTLDGMAHKHIPVPDLGPNIDGRSQHQWCFYADGHAKACVIWDYRGERWSAFGPRDVYEELGWLA
jgi:hypothetical protein